MFSKTKVKAIFYISEYFIKLVFPFVENRGTPIIANGDNIVDENRVIGRLIYNEKQSICIICIGRKD